MKVWEVVVQHIGCRKRTASFPSWGDMALWILKYPEGGKHGVGVISIRGPVIRKKVRI